MHVRHTRLNFELDARISRRRLYLINLIFTQETIFLKNCSSFLYAIMIKFDRSRIKLYYNLCLKFFVFVAIQKISFILIKACNLFRTKKNLLFELHRSIVIFCIIITFYMMININISYNIFAKIHVVIETNFRDRDYDVVKNRTNINKLIDEFKFVNYICDRNTIYKKRFIKRIRNINNIKTNYS